MGRRELDAGEAGPITYRGVDPATGRWSAEAKLRQAGAKPEKWQATCRYRTLRTRELKVITATDASKTRAAGKLRAAVDEAKKNEGLDLERGKLTVRQGVKEYVTAMERGDLALSPRTVREYGYIITRHIDCDQSTVADMRVSDVTAMHIKDEYLRITAAGGHGSLRHVRAVLRKVFERAVDARAIAVNPVDGAGSLPRVRQKPKVYANGAARTKNRALTSREVETLTASLDNDPPHVRALVLVCLDQGLRISEAVSLRWSDVDFDAGTLAVRGKLVRVKGGGQIFDPFLKESRRTGLNERVMPLRQRARSALCGLFEARVDPSATYVFTTPRGGLPDADNYSSLCRIAFDRAGLLDVTIHTLRRTVERDLEQAGATVAERESFMGHTEIIARRHYADHGTVREDVIQRLENVE